MVEKLKKNLYFPIAWYFRFFAAIKLQRWHPRILVVTGSNGKTTLLHLLESQFGNHAKFSHHANSSYGIPFDILGLHRKTLIRSEWIGLILKTPFLAFSKTPKEKIYIVESDADRPYEGKFLASFLNPEVVLWISVARTHALQFDQLVKSKKFATVEEAIAYEFGYFLEYCQKLAVVDGDLPLEMKQVDRTKADVSVIKKEHLDNYSVSRDGTSFTIDNKKFTFPALLPKEVFYGIAMCQKAVEYFDLPFDTSFEHFEMPPGRGSLFAGIKHTTLIDSCYNANLSSMTAMLTMYNQFPNKKKWTVVGDMLEQGIGEKEEHEKLAELLATMDLDRVIFMGPRVSEYTYPKLQEMLKDKIVIEKFLGPKELLDYLLENISGDETIFFKGARFMEGVIENLLQNKKDASRLARREKVWEERRKKFGL